MGKYSVYAVSQGVNPDDGSNVFDMKFYTWAECIPYVKGARFCRYKGFQSEQEADNWLAIERQKRRAYPALERMEASRHKSFVGHDEESHRYANEMGMDMGPYDTEYSPATATIAGTAMPSGCEMPCDDVKFKFSSKCMDFGLDPNVVLLQLMRQWTEMAEMCSLGRKSETSEEDDDEVPW